MHEYACGWCDVCVHTCGGSRPTAGIFPQLCSDFILSYGVTWWTRSHWLGWLANELQESTCLIATNPYEAEVTGTQNIPGIWWAFRNSNIVLVWQALSWLNRLSKPPVALLPFSSGEKTLGKQGEHLGDCPQVQVSLFPSVDHTWYCLPPWVWLPASCSPDCLTGQSVLTYLSDKASEGDKECSICYFTVITHNPCLPASVTRISSELP